MQNRMMALLAATTIVTVVGASIPAFATGNTSSTTSQSTAYSKGVLLRHVKDPKQTLVNVAVDDSSGGEIGHAQKIETFKSGTARAVIVSLSDTNKTVTIPAHDLRYDKTNNTIDARMTKTQIEALPMHS